MLAPLMYYVRTMVSLCASAVIQSDVQYKQSLSMITWYPNTVPFHRLRVSLILGAEGVSSGAAMTGGLVASGEGTWRLL